MDDPAACPTRPAASFSALLTGFAALYLLWGSTYLGIKFAVETLPPFLMAGGRFVLAGGVLYALLRVRGVAAPTARQWRASVVPAALLLLGGNGLVTWGQQTVATGRAALIVATTPLWMVVLGWLFYRGDRPAGRVWLGLAVGFVGAALLIRPGTATAESSAGGLLALALAPVAWSLGSLETRRARPVESTLMTSAMQMLLGGILMLLVGAGLGELPALLSGPVATRSVVAFVYLAVFGGLVGFSTYAWLLHVASPTAVSTYAYVNPLVAVLLGWAVLGERIDNTVLLAAGLILGAVVLITLPRLRKRAEETETLDEAAADEAVEYRPAAGRMPAGCHPGR
ncbi:MAG: EamA family transporter [Gemmataceae bacterium]